MIELQEGKVVPATKDMSDKEEQHPPFDHRGLKNITMQTEVTVVKQSREELKREAKRGSLPPPQGNYAFARRSPSGADYMV